MKIFAPMGARPGGRDRPRIDQPVFERRDLAEHVLHFGGVLHAGKLHDDAIEALALHDGLGHAELVHAVAQRGDVRGDREVAPLAHLLRGQHAFDRGAIDDAGVAALQVRVILLDRFTHLAEIGARGQQHAQAIRHVRIHLDRRYIDVRDAVGLERALEVLRVGVEELLDRAVDVHLVEKIEAAAQVEAQRHRLEADRAPSRPAHATRTTSR